MVRRSPIALVMIVMLGALRTLQGTYAYLLKIEPMHTAAPTGQRQTHPFYTIYRGQLRVLHGNIAVLKRKRHVFVFSLIITPDVEYSPRCGGGVALKEGEPVRWFDITFIWEEGRWRCAVEELAAARCSSLLPEHALVFLYDPALVKRVRLPKSSCYCRDTAYEGGCCIFELPMIELQGTPEEQQAAHLRVEAALPGIRTFNRQASSVVHLGEALYCSLHIDERII